MMYSKTDGRHSDKSMSLFNMNFQFLIISLLFVEPFSILKNKFKSLFFFFNVMGLSLFTPLSAHL